MRYLLMIVVFVTVGYGQTVTFRSNGDSYVAGFEVDCNLNPCTFPSNIAMPQSGTRNFTVAAEHDLVLFWVWCRVSCSVSDLHTNTTPTLSIGSGITQSGKTWAADASAQTFGQLRWYYVADAPSSVVGTHNLYLSITAGVPPTGLTSPHYQVGYLDFSITSGYHFVLHAETDRTTGTCSSNDVCVVNSSNGAPSTSGISGDLALFFEMPSGHTNSQNSPWTATTWDSQMFQSTSNSSGGVGYITSAGGGTVTSNFTIEFTNDDWAGSMISFTPTAGSACPSGMPTGVTTCYYAANGGSDAAAGTKESPWAHLPGMPTWTGSHTPAAGEGFILKGGDTWHRADLGFSWGWGGNAGSPIYIGVDQTWCTGASWTRPILTCDGQDCADNIAGMWTQIWVWADYVTIDNLELTGLYVDGSGDRHAITWGNGVFGEIKNNYVHGWYRGASGGGEARLIGSYLGGGTDVIRGLAIHDNVIDGSDATGLGKTGMAIYSGAYSIYNNIVRYVYNGINGGFNRLYGNVVEHVDFYSTSGDHCNGIYQKGRFDTSETTVYEYNNIVRDSLGDSCVYWYVVNNENCPSCTTYYYNNLMYNVNGGLAGFGGDPGNRGGTAYYYNDTLVAYSGKSDNCIGGSSTENQGTVHYANIHCITGADSITGGANTYINDGGNLLRTPTQAAADCTAGSNCYVATGTYPYAPKAGGNTIGAGVNESALVATFGAAFGYDTSLAVGYDAVNHRVIAPARTVVSRGSTWDTGAYQYATAGTPSFQMNGSVKVTGNIQIQ